MIPVVFGDRHRQLLGVYDAAALPKRRVGIVILNPAGWEYMRAHRTLRTLAARISATGGDVLRFDLSGTGDSWGDAPDATASRWMKDVDEAVEELKSLAGVNRVHLIGLRIGARLAIAFAAKHPQAVDRILVWDPVGTDQAEALGEVTSPLAVPASLLQELMALDSAGAPVLRRMSVALSHGQSLPRDLRERWEGEPMRSADSAVCWVEERDFGAGAIPAELIAKIAQWTIA